MPTGVYVRTAEHSPRSRQRGVWRTDSARAINCLRFFRGALEVHHNDINEPTPALALASDVEMESVAWEAP